MARFAIKKGFFNLPYLSHLVLVYIMSKKIRNMYTVSIL